EIDEGNGAARLGSAGKREAFIQFVQNDACDVRQVEAACIINREPVQPLQFARPLNLCRITLNTFGISDEEARVKAARAVGRGDGAGHEIKRAKRRAYAMREIACPVRMLALLERVGRLADDEASFLEGFADRGHAKRAGAQLGRLS